MIKIKHYYITLLEIIKMLYIKQHGKPELLDLSA